jgi:hypothetical protein
MGSGFGAAIGEALVRWICILVACAFGLGALAMWGVPKLWELLKPLIHAATS